MLDHNKTYLIKFKSNDEVYFMKPVLTTNNASSKQYSITFNIYKDYAGTQKISEKTYTFEELRSLFTREMQNKILDATGNDYTEEKEKYSVEYNRGGSLSGEYSLVVLDKEDVPYVENDEEQDYDEEQDCTVDDGSVYISYYGFCAVCLDMGYPDNNGEILTDVYFVLE